MKTLMMTMAILLIASISASAQDDPVKATDYRVHFTYDFRYPGVMSRENLSESSLLVDDALTRGLTYGIGQIDPDKNPRSFLGASIGAALVTYLVGNVVNLTGHEDAHLQPWSKAGIGSKYYLYADSDGNLFPAPNCWAMFKNIVTRSAFGLKGAASSIDQAGIDVFNNDPVKGLHGPEMMSAWNAGGLNQDQYTSERFADRVLEGRAVFLDVPIWLIYMLSAAMYPKGSVPGDNDIRGYLEAEEQLGIHSNFSHVQNIHWLKLLNGSSLAMMAGIPKYFQGKGAEIVPIFNPLPEFASYLTLNGPTLKTRIPWKVNCGFSAWIEPSLQVPLDKSGASEWGLRVRAKLNQYCAVSLGGFLQQGGGSWVEGGVTLTPCRWFEIGVAADRGRGETYEREITGKTFSWLEKSEWSLKLVAAVNIRF